MGTDVRPADSRPRSTPTGPTGPVGTPEQPLLVAAIPQEWFRTHLAAYVGDPPGSAPPAHGWVDPASLLADDGAQLARAHRLILDGHGRGGTTQMAAKWLIGWTVGRAAATVGYVLGTGGAGVLLDSGPWLLRPNADGWVDRVDVSGCPVVVCADHPWAGQAGVVVVADEAELVRTTVDSLVAALRPVVDRVRRLARVGARALWAEVADELGLATTYRPELPGQDDVVARLTAAVDAPGAPWRVSPTLRTTTAPWGERVYVGRKGGCCLAYQRPEEPEPEDQLSDDLRAYHALFEPALPDGKRVCNTCSLRDEPGCDARQLFWLERGRAAEHAR